MRSILILFLSIFLTSCQLPQIVDIEPASQTVIEMPDIGHDEPEQEQDVYDTGSFDEMYIHWDDGRMQYGSRVEGNNRVLYTIENRGTYLTPLASFPSLNVEWGHAETEWCRPQGIFSFDVIDDWIILSAGEIQGSMRNFFGDLHRIRRDGSGRETFGLWSFNPSFTIIDGWVYHNIWCLQNPSEWIRIRPDGTDRESLEGTIYSIILFTDGYIYGTHTASGRGNLARWRPESNEPIVLFTGDSLPIFENSDSMGFFDITVSDDYVTFTAFVWGYRDGDSWRGSMLYSAEYRVDKDGSNLTLLNAEYH